MSTELLVLGLGSNLGQPIQNLRKGLSEIKKIAKVLKVSSIYESEALLKPDSPAEWNRPYLNAALLVEIKKNHPEELLKEIKLIEERISPRKAERWSPRGLDIDLLYWQNKNYSSDHVTIPHKELMHRPFALLPLLEVLPNAELERSHGILNKWKEKVPFNTRISSKYYWPQLVGIINLTPDSFSDGIQNLTEKALFQKIEKHLIEGAEVIDLGAQSTRPGAEQLDFKAELARLEIVWPLLNDLRKNYIFKTSLDTYQPKAFEKALTYSVDYLNDVTGLADEAMIQLVKDSQKKAIVMHSLGVPPKPDQTLALNEDPTDVLIKWWKDKKEKLVQKGISSEQIIFDPGIGFGKTKDQNLQVLQNLDKFSEIKEDVLIGHSRKSFLTLFTNKKADERDPETAMITKQLNQAYVQYLRVHNISSQTSALRKQDVSTNR